MRSLGAFFLSVAVIDMHGWEARVEHGRALDVCVLAGKGGYLNLLHIQAWMALCGRDLEYTYGAA